MIRVTAFVSKWSIVGRTHYDLYFLYFLSQGILKLTQSMRGHLVTLIEVGMHLISCNFGRNCFPAIGFPLSKNESFAFYKVYLTYIKARLTKSALQNEFLTLYCGDVSIVSIKL